MMDMGDKIISYIGVLPDWIIAAVAVGGFWLTWRKAKEAANEAKAATALIANVSTQIDGLLQERDKAKVEEGASKTHADLARAKEVVRAEAIADADADAKVRAAGGGGDLLRPIGSGGGGVETPVTDRRVTSATERMADAGERVAAAGERAADAAEDKKTS